MEISIISRETIKPSSPTPSQVRTFKLSLIDQLAPLCYTPVILFYPLTDSQLKLSQISTLLKKSLSKTLARFYSFAGRVKDSFSIDCNDEGAPYLEAQVSSPMSEFLKKPNIELLNLLLPCQPFDKLADRTVAQVAIQVNLFACGGIAIGVCMLHTTIDVNTMSSFLNNWAAAAREANDQGLAHLDFTSASSLFPSKEVESYSSLVEKLYFKEGKYTTRRFVFNAEAIATLQAKAKSEHFPNPTRDETLTGFIWKSTMAASRVQSNSPRPSISIYAVNMRPRMEKPLSNYAIGTLLWPAFASNDSSDIVLHDLVGAVRQCIHEVDSDFIRNLQGDAGFAMICEYIKMIGEQISSENVDRFAFSSWCDLGFNELDFGWGKPIWVGLAGGGSSVGNLILFKETSWGNGTEAWMTLDEKIMAVLEHDPDFLAFASPNPSVQSP